MIAQVAAAAAVLAVPLLDAPRAQDLAVAGDQVVVTRGGPSGRLRVDALAVDGSARRSLLATRRLGRRWTSLGLVFASPQQVTVIGAWEKRVPHGPDRARARLYIGPRAGPLRLVRSVGGRNWRRKWIPVGAAVDGDRVLVSEVGLKPIQRSRLRLYVPGAVPRLLPWGDRALPPLALAGDHVAYIHRATSRVVVADLESGTRQASMKVADPTEIDLAEDGTVLGEGVLGLATAAPGRPRKAVRGGGLLFAARFAGTRIAATDFDGDEADRPVVLDPGARTPRPVGVFSRDLRELDADPGGVGWIANGCVLYAPVDAAAPAEPPPGPCPRVELALVQRDETLRGRRVHMDVDCVAAPAAGCRGAVILRIGGSAGRGRFHLRSGTERPVTVRLTRRAARIVRRRVRRFGLVGLRMGWSAPDARASRDQRIFVIDRVR